MTAEVRSTGSNEDRGNDGSSVATIPIAHRPPTPATSALTTTLPPVPVSQAGVGSTGGGLIRSTAGHDTTTEATVCQPRTLLSPTPAPITTISSVAMSGCGPAQTTAPTTTAVVAAVASANRTLCRQATSAGIIPT